MPELTIEQRDILITLCKQRVAATGLALIVNVSSGHKSDIGINEPIGNYQAEQIAHYIAQTDGRYEIYQSDPNWWAIRYNTNYELSESVRLTNESVRVVNDREPDRFKSHKTLTISAIIVAGASALFTVGSAYLQSKDSTDEELKLIRLQLQMQSQELKQAQTSLKEINSSIQKKDSVFVTGFAPAKTTK